MIMKANKRFFAILILVFCTLILNAQHVERTISFEGNLRRYMEYIPTSSPDGSMPVVFLLHGLGDDCENFSQIGFENVAPNWIVITPEATEANVMGWDIGTAWAAGVGAERIPFIGTVNLNAGENDEGFILAILDLLERKYNVDTDSVFVAGFSMGGFMSNKMAVKHADRIKAIASVSGTLGHFQDFEPTGNISTMHIHGTFDDIVTYADASFDPGIGIEVKVGMGAETLIDTWRNYNGCSANPIVHYFEDIQDDGLTFEQYTYKNSRTGIKTVFIKVNNGEHDWYDGSYSDIDYNTEIYKFFTGHENGLTGINDVKIVSNICVYPNPAVDIVNINTDDDSEIVILNAIGKKVKCINAVKGLNTINVSELPNGLYLIVSSNHTCKLTIAK